MSEFEWDLAKAATNIRKHGISFETATRAFDDPLALTQEDSVVDSQQRWKTIAAVDRDILVVVIYTYPSEEEQESLIRLISARKADRKERRQYAKQAGH